MTSKGLGLPGMTSTHRAETSAHGRRHEVVYQALRERIIWGAYGPGYRIVVDVIADELGVSATPVREAMRRLEAERLISYRPNVGAQVAVGDPRRLAEEVDVIAVLDGAVTALAAPWIDDPEVARLTEINHDMAEAIAGLDLQRLRRRDHDFHRLIHGICPNGALVAALHRLDLARRLSLTQITGVWIAAVAEHRILIQLLAGHVQAAIIEEVARQHTFNTLTGMRRDRGWVS